MDIEKKEEEEVGETKEGGEALSGLGFDTGKEISTVFNQRGVGFVLLPAGQKKPPDRPEWQKKENQYSFQEINGYRGARNIGLVASFGYIILDVDDPSALNGLELPKSTKWETRTNAERHAIWFKCEDSKRALSKKGGHADKGKLELFDSRQLVEVEDEQGKKTLHYAPIGEIKLRRTYEVIPPSWKRVDGKRTEYRFLDGGEIAPRTIPLERLISSLDKLGIVFSSKPAKKAKKASVGTIAIPSLEKGKKKNETPTNAANPVTANDLPPIELEKSILLSTPEGDRNNQLNGSSFNLALKGEEYEIVLAELAPVARKIGLIPQEIEPTIRSGWSAGMDQRTEEEAESERKGGGDPSIFMENRKVVTKLIADDIMSDSTFKTRRGDLEIFCYDAGTGIYNEGGDELIREEVTRRLGRSSGEHVKNEVIGHIRDSTLTEQSAFNKHTSLLHMENGIFDLSQVDGNGDTTELGGFDPEIISITKLPIRYAECADCPKFKEFLEEILTPSDILAVQEIFGSCLLKDYRFQKAVMCVGDGSNGKSTLLNVLKEFLGRDNAVSIPLQDLSRRFTPAQLFGKLADIHPDLPSKALRETGIFKMLTGGDPITAEVKYKAKFITFRNYAKLIFSTNEIPKSSDDSDAFFRRWILINFPNKFEGDEDDTLHWRKIATPEELSGIFNWALIGLRRLLDRGNFEHHETEKVRDEYQRMASPLYAFTKDRIEEDPEELISKEDFYNSFVDYCKSESLPVISKSVVGKELPEYVHVVSQYKRVSSGRATVWKGIKYRTDTDTDTDTETNLRDYLGEEEEEEL